MSATGDVPTRAGGENPAPPDATAYDLRAMSTAPAQDAVERALLVGTDAVLSDVDAHLRAAGLSTVRAEDTPAALALVDGGMGVVVADWRQGPGLGPQIRQRPEVAEVHVLVCVPRGQVGAGSQAREAGADDVVPVPIEAPVLIARVRAGLDRVRLRSREALLRSLIGNVPGAVYRCRCDSDWTMEWISPQITAICGHEPEALIANAERSFASLIHPEDRRHVEETVLAGVRAGRPFSVEYRLVRPDGSQRWVLERGQEQRAPDGRCWLDGIIFDITERHAAEEAHRQQAVAEAQLSEVRASRQRIVAAADAARRRVEQDLHDGAQQRFVSAALQVKMLAATVPGLPAGAREALDAIHEELRSGLEDLRDLAHGLHPALLSDRGLADAVSALAGRAPLPVELRASVTERLPEPVEVSAYFLVAESLTNVAKYADASTAWVSLQRANGDLHVEVGDDGRGGADPAAGTGLQGLSDRLTVVDGVLSIESPRGGGTVVRARIPLPG